MKLHYWEIISSGGFGRLNTSRFCQRANKDNMPNPAPTSAKEIIMGRSVPEGVAVGVAFSVSEKLNTSPVDDDCDANVSIVIEGEGRLVGVFVGKGVIVLVGVGVFVEELDMGLFVGVGVYVGVGVFVGVGVYVGVGVCVGVTVGVDVGVEVGNGQLFDAPLVELVHEVQLPPPSTLRPKETSSVVDE